MKSWVGLLFVQKVSGRQSGAEAEGAGRQQHVLHGGVDGGSGRARGRRRSLHIGVRIFNAGDDPHGRFVEVVGQILHRRVLPVVLLAADAWRRRALEVSRPDHLVESALVVDLHGLFDLRVLDDQEPPALGVAPVGGAGTGLQDLPDQLVGHRIGLQPAHGPHGLHDLEQVRVARHRASLSASLDSWRTNHTPTGRLARAGRMAHDRRDRHVSREASMTTVGSGSYEYEVIETWAKLPGGWTFGPVSAVATDSQDRVYAFQRKDPPIIVFDREGNYLSSWGSSAITDPHGIAIINDVIYLTDREDHVALKFTLDGKPLMILGTRGKASDTGATKDIELPPRSAGPFNKPTEMVVAPSGDLYVSDGYRNSRVHHFSADGKLLDSWGTPGKQAPGEFHLPHSVWVDRQGMVYVCDRENNRIQVFTTTGQFTAQWTDIHRPTDIYIDAQEIVYVSDLKPTVTIMDKRGAVIARWDSPMGHGLWVDSVGDIYVADVLGKKVTKYVRKH